MTIQHAVARCMGPWPHCGHAAGYCTACPEYQTEIVRSRSTIDYTPHAQQLYAQSQGPGRAYPPWIDLAWREQEAWIRKARCEHLERDGTASLSRTYEETHTAAGDRIEQCDPAPLGTDAEDPVYIGFDAAVSNGKMLSGMHATEIMLMHLTTGALVVEISRRYAAGHLDAGYRPSAR